MEIKKNYDYVRKVDRNDESKVDLFRFFENLLFDSPVVTHQTQHRIISKVGLSLSVFFSFPQEKNRNQILIQLINQFGETRNRTGEKMLADEKKRNKI